MNVMLKQMEYSHETELHGYKFKIRPFPAFTAMNMSGEIISFISPLLTVVAPLLASDNALNTNVNTSSISLVNGDKVEALVKKLIVNHNNIIVEIDGNPESLDFDLANEVFCGQAQDMYVLAYKVISINFPGIFSGINNLSGKVIKLMEKKMKSINTDDLMLNNLNSSN